MEENTKEKSVKEMIEELDIDGDKKTAIIAGLDKLQNYLEQLSSYIKYYEQRVPNLEKTIVELAVGQVVSRK